MYDDKEPLVVIMKGTLLWCVPKGDLRERCEWFERDIATIMWLVNLYHIMSTG
jgi:hypothetical protein